MIRHLPGARHRLIFQNAAGKLGHSQFIFSSKGEHMTFPQRVL
jgi:hypothetical protein